MHCTNKFFSINFSSRERKLYFISIVVLAFFCLPVFAETQIYFVRHAEVKRIPGKPLSPRGKKRARALARLLEKKRITHLFASHTNRTRDTLRPLAKRLRLPIRQEPRPGSRYRGKKVTNRLSPAYAIQPLIRALKRLPPGAVAVVAGNGENLYPIMSGLGAPDNNSDMECSLGEKICLPCKSKSCFNGRQYNNLWLLIPAKKGAVLRKKIKYGGK